MFLHIITGKILRDLMEFLMNIIQAVKQFFNADFRILLFQFFSIIPSHLPVRHSRNSYSSVI